MLSSFLALSFSQKKVFIEAWCLFLIWDWRIRRQSYDVWQSEIFGTRKMAKDSAERAIQLIPIIEKAGRNHIRKMNCLRRCLVTRQMLEKRGIKTDLHFGIRFSENKKTQAHCWLTQKGQLINDGDEVVSTYTELRPRHDKRGALLKTLN